MPRAREKAFLAASEKRKAETPSCRAMHMLGGGGRAARKAYMMAPSKLAASSLGLRAGRFCTLGPFAHEQKH